MSGATSVSGMRTPGGSRRGHDTARIRKGLSGGSITVHIIILGLAVLLWWIARDMVSVNRQLPNAGRVRFELSAEVAREWKIFSNPISPVSLDVSGPTKEINDFAAGLQQNPNRFMYTYTVTQADIANLPENSRRQVMLSVDTRRFATDEANAPPELRVRPIGAGGDDGGTFLVMLERYIERPAAVDFSGTGKGQIQLSFSRSDGRTETGAYTYTADVQTDKEVRMRGPASTVEAHSDANGVGKLRVLIDAKQALENFAKTKGMTIEQVLQQGSIVSTVQLPPIEGVTLRDTQGLEVSFVNVRIAYAQKQDYINVSGEFTVEPVWPNWLAKGKAYVEELPATYPVVMDVLNTQRDSFTRENVSVRLDLTGIERTGLTIEETEGSPVKRARVDAFYSLNIDSEKLTYQFVNETVTARRYQPVTVVIVWEEP